VEAYRVVRCRGAHTVKTIGSQMVARNSDHWITEAAEYILVLLNEIVTMFYRIS
jgi:hypothetical protein